MSQTQFTGTKDELVARFIPLLQEVKDMTTSSEVEQWLNTKYGIESELYGDLSLDHDMRRTTAPSSRCD